MTLSSPPAETTRLRMSNQATRDTRPEMRLRRELHRRGFRYRVNFRPIPTLNRTADIVFTKARVAVFVDGCFWHLCPVHGCVPKSNAEWWTAKLAKNRMRDQETDDWLAQAGWVVVRVWEHADLTDAADRVGEAVRRAPLAPRASVGL